MPFALRGTRNNKNYVVSRYKMNKLCYKQNPKKVLALVRGTRNNKDYILSRYKDE